MGNEKAMDLTEYSATTQNHTALLDQKYWDRISMRFAANYGGIWLSKFDDDRFGAMVNHEWRQTLYGLGEHELADGMKIVFENHPEFPPSPTQFKLLCSPPKECVPFAQMYRELPPPERPEKNMALGEKTIQECLSMLKIGDAKVKSSARVRYEPESENLETP